MRVKPVDLKVGDVFYECSAGMNLRMVVIKPVIHSGDQWKWVAEDESGEPCSYLITDGYEHYGPKIYTEPQYVRGMDYAD